MSQSRDLAESSSSSSRTATSVPWIFLSHSGHQKDFTRRLNEELVHAGHSPFFDQDAEFSLPKGRPFPERILESCEGCKMGIIVLSREYMESFWPMLELQQLKNAQVILYPLFYQMQPADLTSDGNLRRWQHQCDTWQSRASDLQKTISSRGSGIQINKDIASWAAALKELKDRSGDVRTAYKSDDDYLNAIISHVCATIPPPQSYKLGDDVKGGERIQREMDKHFEQHGRSAADGVTMLGVFGIGGSGKSTACQHMTNYYSKEFPGRSFYLELPSNKDESQNLLIQIKGILSKLIAKRLDEIATLDQAMARLQDRLHRNKVFLALDNVWDDTDGAGWDMAKKIMLMNFMPGSKIMVTSRSEHALKTLFGCRKTCESEQQHSNIVHVLSITEDEAMEALMSYSCLSHFIPQEGLRSLARSCFFDEQCYPLYLKVIGAELRQQGRASFSDQAWEELFFELQSQVKQGLSEGIVVDVIIKSLEKLSPELQDIFKNLVTCMPQRRYGYISLQEKCTWLSFLQDGFTTQKIRSKLLKLEYHGLLEIREEDDDIIIHDLHKLVAKKTLSPDAPANYFLDLKDSKLSKKKWSEYKYIYGEYNVMDREWDGTPILAKKLISVKCMKALSSLELVRCEVEGISGWEGTPNLVFLKLSHFHHLENIGHLGSLLKLEVLIVNSCDSLKVVNVGRIPKLRILNLSYNSGLVDFFFVQSSVWSPSKLQELDVSGCRDLKRLPNLRHSDGLRTLRADGCLSLEEVRISPLAFTSLEVFDLFSGCQLRVQDATRSSLTALEFLTSTFCDHHGPKDSAAGSRLQHLILTINPLKDLAAGSSVNVNGLVINVGGLASLKVLHLGSFPALQEIASLSSLVNLRDLHLTGCGSLKEITGFGALSNLEILYAFRCSSLQKIDLGALTKLRYLYIEECSSLQKIDLGALTKLGYLSIEKCSSLQKIDLGALTKLGKLSIQNCTSLQKIDSLGALAKLDSLSIQNCTSLQKIDLVSLGAFTQLRISSSLHQITGLGTDLREFSIERCPLLSTDSLGLPTFSSSLGGLTQLTLESFPYLQEIASLSSLVNLHRLCLDRCAYLKEIIITGLGAFTNLEFLRVIECSSLQNIVIGMGALTQLQELEIIDCLSLQQIIGLGTHLTRLHKLSIGGCPLLASLSEPLRQLHTFSTLEIEKMKKELAEKKAKEERQEFEEPELQEAMAEEARFWLKEQEEDIIGTFFMERPVRSMEEELSRTDLQRTIRAAVEEEERRQLIWAAAVDMGRPVMGTLLEIEKMKKELAKKKAKEERQEFEEKFQELRAMRIQRPKKQGTFFPKEDNWFRATVEEEQRQKRSKVGGTNFSPYQIQPEFKTVDPLKMRCKGTLEQGFTLPSLPTSLERLVINGCSSLIDVSSLTSLTSLKYLNLAYCTSLKELPNLQHLSNLRGIYLKGCSIDDKMIKQAKQMIGKGEVNSTAYI